MKLLQYFLILAFIVSLESCLKGTDEIKCVGDAIVVSKTDGTRLLYGISLYAYTNSVFESVQVTSSADASKSYVLKADQGIKTNFIYDMPESEYSQTKPAASTYTFTAKLNNGSTQVFTDELTDKVLPVPTFSKCVYNNQLMQIEVAWPEIDGAVSYAINVFNGSTPVYWSNALSAATKSFSIISGGSGWASGFNPETGKSYKIRLFAYLPEVDGNSNNIQAISFADQSVIWGK